MIRSMFKQNIEPGQLTVHADRGPSMKSKQVAHLMADMGITKSHSRPHVSNDNPYSEAQFKTLKYCPQFPDRFGSIQDARGFCQPFSLSRDHTIIISNSGLLTIAGGKWTTYRQMAEDSVNHAATLAGLEARPCVTKRLSIHGYHKSPQKFGSLALYGSDAPAIQDLLRGDVSRQEPIHPELSARCGEVIWAVRFEGARTVDDFLARRTRSLFLNARAACEAAPKVAALIAAELGYPEQWQREQVAAFETISRQYLPVKE